MNELALFAGAGGGILGGHLLGWRTVCAVEWEAYPASVLCARQNDGILPAFPIWDDIQTFDGRPWRGIVDVVSGGFPCQDISAAGGGQESRESEAECGKKWHGSFVKYDLDSSLWKTHQCSLLGDLEPYSETWPRWGLMRDGECWEQPMLALHTKETESGLWPTPVSDDTGQRKKKYAQGGTPLSLAVNTWPTPTTSTGGPQMMGDQVRPSGHKGSNNLAGAVQRFPTPRARDYKDGETIPPSRKLNPQLATLGQKVIIEGSTGGTLNPMWVEWLMGWPLGWTDLKPLETDKFQKWLDEHGGRYELPDR
jgi:hypothetical protein